MDINETSPSSLAELDELLRAQLRPQTSVTIVDMIRINHVNRVGGQQIKML